MLASALCYGQADVIHTLAGTGAMAYGGDGGIATDAALNFPEGLCLDDTGNILIADSDNSRIRKINKNTGCITTIVGVADSGYNGDGILAINAKLYLPMSVRVDDTGNVYIADGFNSRVRKVTAATGIINTIAGNGIAGYSGDGGQATAAKIYWPSGLCLDKKGNLYIADYVNYVIRKMNLSTGIITTFAGNGTQGYSGDGGPATQAQLYSGVQVFADSIGNIYIADEWNNVIRKVDVSTNVITTIAGTGVAGYSGDNGIATNAMLNEPVGLFIDSAQNIYFTQYLNGAVRKIDGATHIISTIAGTGVSGFSGDGGFATNAQLQPADVCTNKYGEIFIADYGNMRIRKINSNGTGVANLTMNQLNNVTISPNPAKDHVAVNGINKNISYQLTNVLGQEITVGILKAGNSIIDLSDYLPGIYLLKLEDPDDGTKVVKRVIRE